MEAIRSGGIKGVKIYMTINLTHFLFVDGLHLFYDRTLGDASRITYISSIYIIIMGMEINV
jgi:hypothetical protein